MAVAPRDAPVRGFARYWAAAAISSFGSAVTSVAMPILVVRTMGATPFEVGIVNAAQLLPYAALGLLAGVYVDRWRRRPILVWSGVGRALALGAIPLLWALHALPLWVLVALLLAFGACSVFGFAATQSLLPRLVPTSDLVTANARLDQTDAAASTLGPALGGGLVGLVGAPVAIVVDAVSYIVDAVLNAGLRVEEPRRGVAGRNLLREIREGLAWGYRHPTLGPLSISTHVWFLANSAVFTVLAVIALRTLDLSALVYSLLLTTNGLAGLVGATLAPTAGRRWGTGPTIIATRLAYPLGWLVVVLLLTSSANVVALFITLAMEGLAGGVSNAHEMAVRQGVTPDELLGRVNASMRSANRTIGALGALIGGALLAAVGGRTTIACVVVTFAVAAAIAIVSPLRTYRDARRPSP